MKSKSSTDRNILVFPAPFTIWQKFNNNSIIVNFITGNYCNLNNEGYKIIELLKNNIVSQNLPEAITQIYPVETSSYINIIETLLAQKIITVKETNHKNCVDADFLSVFFKICNFDKVDFQIYTNMQHVLKLDDIFNVDKKGWPVQNG